MKMIVFIVAFVMIFVQLVLFQKKAIDVCNGKCILPSGVLIPFQLLKKSAAVSPLFRRQPKAGAGNAGLEYEVRNNPVS